MEYLQTREFFFEFASKLAETLDWKAILGGCPWRPFFPMGDKNHVIPVVETPADVGPIGCPPGSADPARSSLFKLYGS